MLDDMWRVMTWPLRSLGLEQGRALANAQPSLEQRQAQRLEQWAFIRARFEGDAPTSAAARHLLAVPDRGTRPRAPTASDASRIAGC